MVIELSLVLIAQAPKRNHPLMLLSGVATNAVGFDLSPGVSELDHDDAIGVDEVPYDECILVLCEQISGDISLNIKLKHCSNRKKNSWHSLAIEYVILFANVIDT